MNTIRQMGYTLLSMPAADVQPLLLLEKTGKGTAQSLNASISDLFESEETALPSASADIPLPSTISDTEELDLKADANFNLFTAFTRFFGGNTSANIAIDRNSSVQLKLNNPQKNTINILKLNAYVSSATLSAGTDVYLDRIKKGEVYVISEIIKAKSFSLEEENKNAIEAGATVPVKKIVDANIEVARKKDKNKIIEYNGDSDLTIGIKAHLILYKEGKFTVKNTDELKTVREGDFPSQKLTGNEGIITIEI